MTSKNSNQAGKGHAPRPVDMAAFGNNYDQINFDSLRVTKDDPFDSEDHDNDDDLYAERVGYP